LAQSRGITPCDRPDPDGPGGLGAEESGTERTGSTQNQLSQMGAAGGWRKWGSNMMYFNDPVTRHFPGMRPIRPAQQVFVERLLRRGAVGAIMSVG